MTTNGTTSIDNDLLAIWDAYNGTGGNGQPPNWESRYWSATPSASGHAIVNMGYGHAEDINDLESRSVALQVL